MKGVHVWGGWLGVEMKVYAAFEKGGKVSWTDYVETTLTSICCQAALVPTCTYVRMYVRICCPCVRAQGTMQALTCFLRK